MSGSGLAGDIRALAAAIVEGTRAQDGELPEARLRRAVQPILENALERHGVRSSSRNEATLRVPEIAQADVLDAPLTAIGRADAIYNRFVIEFEPPGSLRPSLLHSATTHAVTQVQQYLHGLSNELGIDLSHVAGCATDGTWLIYVTWERGAWRVRRPIRTDENCLGGFLETLVSLSSGRGLTARNLDEDFGRSSDVARSMVQALVAILSADSVAGRTRAMFDQWQTDMANASGPFSSTHLDEWVELCESLNVSSDVGSSLRVLFSLQTYFALVAKLVAVIVLSGVSDERLVASLLERDPRSAFAELESGRLTARTGALNVIEPGIFSWYSGEHDQRLTDALKRLATLASEYAADFVEITPVGARDVLKDLYQRLVPRPIRHRLGEYYTPDWLAERVIDQALVHGGSLSPDSRILDPACGSGTFLVEAISRVLAGDDGESPAVVHKVLENIVGFDLSPLAVQASKVNYLLAVAPRLRRLASPVFLPVYLADSVSPPRLGGLLDGEVYLLDTSEGEWRVPIAIAESHFLPVLGGLFEIGLAQDLEASAILLKAQEILPLLEKGDERVLHSIGALYQKLRDLHRSNRDGMWWNLLMNAFAPSFQGRFDLVVGNPPWVSWETLPERYRIDNEEQWSMYALRPQAAQARRQASANVRLDLSMLFVARCVQRYLREGGLLAFVITASVFKSELAGRGFRRRHLPPDSSYRFSLIEDLSSLGVFDDATNQAAILVAERRPSTERSTVPVIRWDSIGPRAIPAASALEEVLRTTARRHLYGEPVDPNDDASPMLTMPRSALLASRPIRRQSPYMQLIREGINTRGANGVFFVEVVEDSGPTVTIRNLPEAGRDAEIPQLIGTVERDVIKRLLRGSDVNRDGAEANISVLFFHDTDHLSAPLNEREVRNAFPLAFEFMKKFERALKRRRPFRNFDPTGPMWLGLYSVTTAALAPFKVVVREIASSMIAAPVYSADVVPDHKLHVIPCGSQKEAERLAMVLNSHVVDFVLRSFAISTSITGSFLRYIGIRDLSNAPRTWVGETLIAKALGLSDEEYRVLASIAQGELVPEDADTQLRRYPTHDDVVRRVAEPSVRHEDDIDD